MRPYPSEKGLPGYTNGAVPWREGSGGNGEVSGTIYGMPYCAAHFFWTAAPLLYWSMNTSIDMLHAGTCSRDS